MVQLKQPVDCTFHLVDATAKLESIHLDRYFLINRCLIMDEFLQNVIINQEGELYVGGVGVFAGYLGRDDLTEKVLLEIDGEMSIEQVILFEWTTMVFFTISEEKIIRSNYMDNALNWARSNDVSSTHRSLHVL